MKKMFLTVCFSVFLMVGLSACFESSPESVVEDYIESMHYQRDFEKGSKFLSFNAQKNLSASIVLQCNLGKLSVRKYNELMKKYDNDPTVYCLEKISKNDLSSFGTVEILGSEVYADGKKARVKIERLIQGMKYKDTVELEKINNEWKITNGMFL